MSLFFCQPFREERGIKKKAWNNISASCSFFSSLYYLLPLFPSSTFSFLPPGSATSGSPSSTSQGFHGSPLKVISRSGHFGDQSLKNSNLILPNFSSRSVSLFTVNLNVSLLGLQYATFYSPTSSVINNSKCITTLLVIPFTKY